MKKRCMMWTLLCMATMLSQSILAQSNGFWKPVQDTRVSSLEKEFRNSMPSKYHLFELDQEAFSQLAQTAPTRKSLVNSNTLLSLPSNDGKFITYRVLEASVLSDGLKQQYPNIRSYVAQGVEDPSSVARFSISPIECM